MKPSILCEQTKEKKRWCKQKKDYFLNLHNNFLDRSRFFRYYELKKINKEKKYFNVNLYGLNPVTYLDALIVESKQCVKCLGGITPQLDSKGKHICNNESEEK